MYSYFKLAYVANLHITSYCYNQALALQPVLIIETLISGWQQLTEFLLQKFYLTENLTFYEIFVLQKFDVIWYFNSTSSDFNRNVPKYSYQYYLYVRYSSDVTPCLEAVYT